MKIYEPENISYTDVVRLVQLSGSLKEEVAKATTVMTSYLMI